MWGMTVSLADIADGYSGIDKGLISAVKGKRLARLARKGKVPGVYGQGQAEAAEDAFAQVRRQQARASMRAKTGMASQGSGVNSAGVRVGQYGTGQREAAGDAFAQARKQQAKQSLDARLKRAEVGDQMERWGSEGAAGVVRRRKMIAGGVAGGAAVAAGGGYGGYAAWNSRKKQPVGKAFEDGYVDKASLKPVWQATKQAAKKVSGGVKSGWESGKPSQPFKEMNSPVAAGKALGSQVGSAAKGGWGQLSQAQKYGGLAAAGTGLVGTGVGYGASRVHKADDDQRRSGWRSNTAIGGALATGSAVGLAMTPRDFRDARLERLASRQWSAVEANERARAAKWYRTPWGRKKITRTADNARLAASRHALKSKSKRAQGVAAIGLGAAGVAQGGKMLVQDLRARRSGD